MHCRPCSGQPPTRDIRRSNEKSRRLGAVPFRGGNWELSFGHPYWLHVASGALERTLGHQATKVNGQPQSLGFQPCELRHRQLLMFKGADCRSLQVQAELVNTISLGTSSQTLLDPYLNSEEYGPSTRLARYTTVAFPWRLSSSNISIPGVLVNWCLVVLVQTKFRCVMISSSL
jgi:hypothetical protein